MIQQITPQIDTTNMVTILASFCGVLILAVGYLYNSILKLNTEHKEDLKLFDSENKKSSKELLDILNKFYLSMEEGKMSDNESKQKLERIITLLEKNLTNG